MSAVSEASRCQGQQAVQMHRSYHINDEDETEVDSENIAKGSHIIIIMISNGIGV